MCLLACSNRSPGRDIVITLSLLECVLVYYYACRLICSYLIVTWKEHTSTLLKNVALSISHLKKYFGYVFSFDKQSGARLQITFIRVKWQIWGNHNFYTICLGLWHPPSWELSRHFEVTLSQPLLPFSLLGLGYDSICCKIRKLWMKAALDYYVSDISAM